MNRKAFSLDEMQIMAINRKFLNLSLTRKEFQYANQKKAKQKRVENESRPVFSPRLNPRSIEMDRSIHNVTQQDKV